MGRTDKDAAWLGVLDRQARQLVKDTNVPLPVAPDPFAPLTPGLRVMMEAKAGRLFQYDHVDGPRERVGTVESVYRKFILIRLDNGVSFTIRRDDLTTGAVTVKPLAVGKEEGMHHNVFDHAGQPGASSGPVEFDPAGTPPIEPEAPAERWTPDCGLTQYDWLERHLTPERYQEFKDQDLSGLQIRKKLHICSATWQRWERDHRDGEPVPYQSTAVAKDMGEPEHRGAECLVCSSMRPEDLRVMVGAEVESRLAGALLGIEAEFRELRESLRLLRQEFHKHDDETASHVGDETLGPIRADMEAYVDEMLLRHLGDPAVVNIHRVATTVEESRKTLAEIKAVAGDLNERFVNHRHQVGPGHFSDKPDNVRANSGQG